MISENEWKYGNFDQPLVVTVVLCLMWRIDCLQWTLASLESQTEARFKLAIWNNNTRRRRDVERRITECRPSFPVHVVHGDRNSGGIGRFLLIRASVVPMTLPVISIDDDQLLHPEFIAGLVRQFRSDHAAGSWAWRFKPGGTYWDRARCQEGEEAHYIGTGGLIFDPNIASSSSFYNELPDRFARIEDLWFSYYITQELGLKLITAPGWVRQVKDGKDQYHSLRLSKTKFLDWLRSERGWRV